VVLLSFEDSVRDEHGEVGVTDTKGFAIDAIKNKSAMRKIQQVALEKVSRRKRTCDGRTRLLQGKSESQSVSRRLTRESEVELEKETHFGSLARFRKTKV
jgi:hypothetical protein